MSNCRICSAYVFLVLIIFFVADQCRCSTSGLVSTGMGDHIRVQLLVREIYLDDLGLTNHLGQLSLAIPPWVGVIGTGQRVVMLCRLGSKGRHGLCLVAYKIL